MSSGLPDETGNLTPDTPLLNSDGRGKDFHFAIDPWIVTSFSRHDSIPPRSFRDVYYGVTPMKNSKHVVIDAKLRYRQAGQEDAEALLAAVPADINLEATYGL
ncbi:MAG TPA: hypothetical protein VEI57_00785 [Nitrospirota bacterium]|nr:hypothetical protein [Nitrospirota bacterium]